MVRQDPHVKQSVPMAVLDKEQFVERVCRRIVKSVGQAEDPKGSGAPYPR